MRRREVKSEEINLMISTEASWRNILNLKICTTLGYIVSLIRVKRCAKKKNEEKMSKEKRRKKKRSEEKRSEDEQRDDEWSEEKRSEEE